MSKLGAWTLLFCGIIVVETQANHDTSPGGNPKPALSFDEAIYLAKSGMSYYAVVDAMRYELKKIENSASQSTVLNLRINLAVALLDCANHSPMFDVYDPLYEEGQSLLESVLQVQPANSLVLENLSAIRKNREFRAKKEQRERLKKNQASSTFGSNNIDMQTEEDCSVAALDSTKGGDERYEEALALARHGIIFRGVIDAMRRRLARTQRCRSLDPQPARAARLNLAAALISWARRSPRPAQFEPMHREAEALLQAALADDPADALALANADALEGNRRLRRDTSGGGPTTELEERAEDSEGDGGGMAAEPQFLHAGSRDGIYTPRSRQPAVSAPPASPPAPPPPPRPVTEVTAAGGEGDSESRGGRRRWLTIGIPTVPRKGGHDYLEQTLRAIAQQLPVRPDDPLYASVTVVVVNNRPGQHPAFDRARAAAAAGVHADRFRFVEAAVADVPTQGREGTGVPPRVQRQTRAVVAMLRAAAGLGGHFMFMEDDFLLCPHALRALAYVTSKAHAYLPGDGWSAIRVSHGLCGIILMDKDVLTVADYLEKHQERILPDRILPEWFAGETDSARRYLNGRRNMAYRFNLLLHIGEISTIRDTPWSSIQTGESLPRCYDELTINAYGAFLVNEAWKILPECLADDLWPCAHFLPAAAPNASAAVDALAGSTAGGWPRVWVAHSVSHKPAQRRGPLGVGGKALTATGVEAAAESVTLADPSGEALALQ